MASIEKQRKNAAKKLLNLPAGKLEQIDITKAAAVPEWMTRAFRNNRYTVCIDDNAETSHGKAIKAMVQRHDDKPIPFHWSEMQDIKNQIFGLEAIAVEYYPKTTDLVNMHNIYWLWVFKDGVLPIPNIKKI